MTSSILVVEDDDAIRHLVSDTLLDAGFAVATATDGQDALDQLEQHPPDAILLDLMMPCMDGWSFLQACRTEDRFARIPVGLMSAAPLLCRTADAWGVQVAIGKPFALDDLVSQVEHLLNPVRLTLGEDLLPTPGQGSEDGESRVQHDDAADRCNEAGEAPIVNLKRQRE